MKWILHLIRRIRGVEALSQPANVGINEEKQDFEPLPNKNAYEAYTSDQPICNKSDDYFNRWPFSKRIADTLANRKDTTSIVIGLYGPWGDGKTSTLRLMEVVLQDHTHVVVVRFNPWLFQSEEQLLRGFFSTLAAALGKSLPTMKEKIGELFKSYGSILSLATISIGGIVKLEAGDLAKGLGESLSTIELDELKKRIEDILIESGKRIIILIDDIDRLDRSEIHAIFKLVKLSASFHYTSYVLAFDDEMVADAIGEKYGRGGFEAGRAFLEKIIQVPLHLPPPDEISLRKITFEGVDAILQNSDINLSKEKADVFVRHFIDGLEPQLRTPRHAKLYINALMFALPLLKGEVDIVDLMLLEGIRVFYPKLYTTIRKYPDYFLESNEGDRQQREAHRQLVISTINKSLEDCDVQNKERVIERLLEVIFPRLRKVGYGRDIELRWEKEQRICSEKYFKRYFTYSVPPGDIADIEVSNFLEKITAMSPDSADDFMKIISDKGQVQQFIRKLRTREEKIDPLVVRPLALMLARNGALIPRERAMMMSDWTYKQAGIFVAHLLKRINNESDRAAIAKDVIRVSQPLPFAFECLRWMRRDEKNGEEEWMLTPEVEKGLFNSLAERIQAQAIETPLYLEFNEDAPGLYWLWNKYDENESVASHLRARFDQNPEEVDAFLIAFVGESWDMMSGLPHRGDFKREEYNAVAKLIDPALIVSILKKRYGDNIGVPNYYPNDEVEVGRKIVHQFVYLHNFVESDEVDDDAEK